MSGSGNRVGSGLHKLPYNGGSFPGANIPGPFDSRMWRRLRASKYPDSVRSGSIRLDPARFGGELTDLDRAWDLPGASACVLVNWGRSRQPGSASIVSCMAIVARLVPEPCPDQDRSTAAWP